MVAVFHEDQFHIVRRERVHQFLRLGPGYVRVGGAVDQPNRNIQNERLAQDKMVASVFEQRAGDDIGALGIFRGGLEEPVGCDLRQYVGAQSGRRQIFGEVGRRCDGDQAGNPRSVFGILQFPCHQGRDPAAHGGADQYKVSTQSRHCCADVPDDRERIGKPASDRAITERAARLAVAGIVQAQKAASGFLRPGLQNGCLLARHVRHKATKEHDAGSGVRMRRRCCKECEPRAVFGLDKFG